MQFCVEGRAIKHHRVTDRARSLFPAVGVVAPEEAPAPVSAPFTLRKDDQGFERVIYSELLIPDYLNTFNDFHTRKSVREFAYAFMMQGFGIDLEHDSHDLTGRVHVVESFIARDGDPDFIPGSWVVGAYIPDDELWQKVLDREINGFSYQAFVRSLDVDVTVPVRTSVAGYTEPDMLDGHRHAFVVMLDDEGSVVEGGTTETEGHSHTISRHTFTDSSDDHVHIFNYIEDKGEDQ